MVDVADVWDGAGAGGGDSPVAADGIRGRRLAALLVLCGAFLIAVMGATSVMTAAPSIGRALGLSASGLQWSLTADTVPSVALLLVGAKLADRFGRRRMFACGVLLLVLGSLVCGAAGDAAMLICGRVVQGIAGAMLAPAALALLTETFVEDADRRRAVAAWSAVGGVGATAGLLLGGLVTAGLGWRWVFVLNAPLCLVILALMYLVVSEPRRDRHAVRLDMRASACLCAAIGAVLYAISQVSASGRVSWQTLATGAAGMALFAGFAVGQRRAADPPLPPRLLRSPNVRAGNVTLLVAGMLVDGLLFTLTVLLQDLHGYTALQYGGVAAVMTVVSVGAAALAQRLVGRLGARRVATAGLGCLAATAALLTATASNWHLEELLGAMIIFGAGMGAAFVAGSVDALTVPDKRDNASAAALQNISFSLGTTLGVAVLATVVATAGHLGSQPLASASHVNLFTGVRTALFVAVGIALSGMLILAAPGARRAHKGIRVCEGFFRSQATSLLNRLRIGVRPD
jgi:MFS family permease